MGVRPDLDRVRGMNASVPREALGRGYSELGGCRGLLRGCSARVPVGVDAVAQLHCECECPVGGLAS